jgi:hypothetical protein
MRAKNRPFEADLDRRALLATAGRELAYITHTVAVTVFLAWIGIHLAIVQTIGYAILIQISRNHSQYFIISQQGNSRTVCCIQGLQDLVGYQRLNNRTRVQSILGDILFGVRERSAAASGVARANAVRRQIGRVCGF